jgi:hypothetical protein
MATVNKRGTKTATPNAGSPLRTVAQDTKTYLGAPAYSRDAKSDLFLLAVSTFYGEETFHEKADDRNARLAALVRTVAAEDPAWILEFIPWLRDKANIRTAAVVAAVEAAKVMLAAGQSGSATGPSRQLLRDFYLVARPDEVADGLAYWLATYGRKIPAGIRRGLGDAARAKYNEYALIKWNGGDKAVRMADVIELCHPEPKSFAQSALFKYILDSRRDPKTPIPEELPMLQKRAAILALPDKAKRDLMFGDDSEEILRAAGITWEQASSWGAMTAGVWENLIPVMGFGALLKNLRNFQEAGISREATKLVCERLESQTGVINSRQLPFRFLTAYLYAQGSQWVQALETALQYSTANIPAWRRRTLALVDTSGSMVGKTLSKESKIQILHAAALFGIALANKGEQVDLYGFDDTVWEHKHRKGASVLRSVEEFNRKVRGGGTHTAAALKATFKGHDRVIIFTDEQTFGPGRGYWQGDVGSQIPTSVPIYSYNLAGYAPAMLDTSSTRHQLAGLTDATFAMIPMIESGQRAEWPWTHKD